MHQLGEARREHLSVGTDDGDTLNTNSLAAQAISESGRSIPAPGRPRLLVITIAVAVTYRNTAAEASGMTSG